MKRIFITLFVGLAFVGCAELMRSPSKAKAPSLTSIQIANSHLGGRPTTFEPSDSVFASLHVRNNKDIANVVWNLIAQNVAGVSSDTVLESFRSQVSVNGNHSARYVLRPGKKGFVPGRYVIQAELVIDGKREDVQSASFTVELSSGERP